MAGLAKYQVAGVIVLTLVLTTACFGRLRVGEVQTKSETVAREDAAEVDVEIRMGTGQLQLSGGADELMSGEFTYNVDTWEPEVDYEVRGDTGYLSIEQPSAGVENVGIPDDDVRYEWDVRLADDMPMSLDVQLGAGESDLDLQSLDLESLTMESGAGDARVAVGGTLAEMDVQLGAGELRLNLNADWQHDMEATIRSGVGQLTLLLPADSGVRVAVEQGLGGVNAINMQQDGDVFVNEAYDQAETTLDIDVQGGIGEIVLEVLE